MGFIRWIILSSALLILSGCSTLTHFSNDKASGYRTFSREECVPYARRVSGIPIRGDAYTWWDQAAGKYARGHIPQPGAVLVLSRTNKLRRGHLAVVTDIISPREINVTHTNWGSDWITRRVTYESVRVEDASANNDWTSVKFWNNDESCYGFQYPAYGFIYKNL